MHKRFFKCLKSKDTIIMLTSTFFVFFHFILNYIRFDYNELLAFSKMHEQIQILPILILTTFFGAIPSITISLIIFFFVAIIDTNSSFSVFLLVISTLIAYFPIHKRWYTNKAKTILWVILATFILGVFWTALNDFMVGKHFDLRIIFYNFQNTLPTTVFIGILGYSLFNFAPRVFLHHFHSGKLYNDEYDVCSVSLTKKNSKLSTKLSAILVGEAIVLGLTAAWFTNIIIYNHPLQEFEIKRLFFLYSKIILMLLNVIIPSITLINYFAQKSIALPIIMMTQAMDDFTQSTVSNEKKSVLSINLLPIHTNDEIEHLHNILKVTTKSISGYIDKIHEEQKLEQELIVAKEASKAKSSFMSNMSHEIRTPMNAILGINEMILRETTNESIKKYASDIKSSGKTLLNIINDILDFSKIEAGKMKIIPSQYDLSSFTNDIINMISKRASDKSLDLNIFVDKNIPSCLFGDETRIKQCVLNLLTNAVKYTHKGSVTLEVGGSRINDSKIILKFKVSDTGIGIKEEDIGKLVTAFERVEESRNRTIEGTGLGLSIVTQLLTLMNSKLEIHSEYGKGSVFSFEIEQNVLDWEPIGDFAEKNKNSLLPNEYEELFRAPNAHILIVDDTALNLEVAKGLLKQTEIKIDTAESGQETLQITKTKKYDIIFIDHRMPLMDGIETLHEIRKEKDNPNINVPCIVLTANVISGAREMYLSEGFDDYLPKPIDAIKFEKLIMKYLDKEKIITPENFTSRKKEKSSNEELPAIDGLDYNTGFKNCASRELFLEMIKEYHKTIEKKSNQIEELLQNGDIKNYTVFVHALKSTSRLVGIMELSEKAKYLEDCGNKESIEEIKAKTPELLSLYRSYIDKLKPIVPDTENKHKEVISTKQYEEALSAIKEFVTAFDYDTVDNIVKQIEEYQIPEDRMSQWNNLKEKISAVDQNGILELLK